MDFLIYGAVTIAAVAAIILIPWSLRTNSSIVLDRLALIGSLLVSFAAILSGFLALLSLVAAAWGMNTRLPWGLGIYIYLMPALSLPAFLLLLFSTVQWLSRVLWLLTVASSLAFYFGDKADRIASGLRPISDPQQLVGMFLNAFTLLLFAIAVIVQSGSICMTRHRRMLDAGLLRPNDTILQ